MCFTLMASAEVLYMKQKAPTKPATTTSATTIDPMAVHVVLLALDLEPCWICEKKIVKKMKLQWVRTWL